MRERVIWGWMRARVPRVTRSATVSPGRHLKPGRHTPAPLVRGIAGWKPIRVFHQLAGGSCRNSPLQGFRRTTDRLLSPPRRCRGIVGRRWVATICLALALLVAHDAQAQTADSEFSRGLIALRSGQLPQAARAFEASLRLAPRPETLLNLGVVRTRMGQLQAAIGAFDRYLQTADPARDAANMRAVRAEISRIRATNTTLVLRLKPPEAIVRVDGQPQAARAGEILMTPGQHDLHISAPGHRTYEKRVSMPAGRFAIALELAPGTPTPPPPPPNSGAPPSPAGALALQAAQPPATVAGTTGTTDAPATGTPVAPEDPGETCLAGDVCIGLAGVLGAPNPLGAGLTLRLPPYVSLAADVQFLPEIVIEGVDVNARLLSFMVRAHPFRGGFFAGMGLALQHIRARGERTGVSVTADLNLPAIAFGLGYATDGGGLYLGIDAAIMIEVGDSTLQTPDYPDLDELPAAQDIVMRLEDEAQDAVDSVKDLLPFMFQVNLLRLGYAF